MKFVLIAHVAEAAMPVGPCAGGLTGSPKGVAATPRARDRLFSRDFLKRQLDEFYAFTLAERDDDLTDIWAVATFQLAADVTYASEEPVKTMLERIAEHPKAMRISNDTLSMLAKNVTNLVERERSSDPKTLALIERVYRLSAGRSNTDALLDEWARAVAKYAQKNAVSSSKTLIVEGMVERLTRFASAPGARPALVEASMIARAASASMKTKDVRAAGRGLLRQLEAHGLTERRAGAMAPWVSGVTRFIAKYGLKGIAAESGSLVRRLAARAFADEGDDGVCEQLARSMAIYVVFALVPDARRETDVHAIMQTLGARAFTKPSDSPLLVNYAMALSNYVTLCAVDKTTVHIPLVERLGERTSSPELAQSWASCITNLAGFSGDDPQLPAYLSKLEELALRREADTQLRNSWISAALNLVEWDVTHGVASYTPCRKIERRVVEWGQAELFVTWARCVSRISRLGWERFPKESADLVASLARHAVLKRRPRLVSKSCAEALENIRKSEAHADWRADMVRVLEPFLETADTPGELTLEWARFRQSVERDV